MRKILEDIRINEDLPYKEKTCYASMRARFYTTIKTQGPSENRYAYFIPTLAL